MKKGTLFIILAMFFNLTTTAYAENKTEESFSTNSVVEESCFDVALDSIISEYSVSYPEYADEIQKKVDVYRVQPSFEEYYNSKSDEAIEIICESLDYYIEYHTKNENVQRAVSGSSTNTVYYVNCPLEQQDNGYYCGPASVYMTIEGIRNHIPSVIRANITNSESANAAAMGTTRSDGTDEGPMRSRLNAMLNGKTYKMDYIANFTQQDFNGYIQESLANNGPVILMLHYPYLSYYPSSYPYTDNHYIVITECVQVGNTVTYTVNDPNIINSVFGTYSNVSASELDNNSYVILWS